MSSSSNLPFSSIKPIKSIGLDQSNPFCSIISQGMLIYTSGTNIIMENTKTNQQKILFNNTFCGQVQLTHHHVTLYNEHLLAIAIKDSITLMHIIVIIPLNPILFNQQAKKDKMYTYYLKNIEQFQQIKEIQFFDQGNLFAIISTYQSLNNLSLFRTSSGETTYQQSFIDTKLSIRDICLNKINCMSVLQHFIQGQIRLCLIVLDELSRKFYFNLALQKDEKIIEYFNQSYQQDSIMVALSNLGHILIFKTNEYQATLINRIDVRQVKRVQSTELKHKRQISVTQQKQGSFIMPMTIQTANNKIIIAYEQSCMLGVLFYSHYNPKNTKFSLIQKALNNYNYVKEIKSIKIAKDNCSLAALIQIYPQKVECKAFNKQNQESLSVTQHVTAFQIQDGYQQASNQTDILANLQTVSLYKQQSQNHKQKHYIALQIDILSNMIDHQQQAYSTQQTFSLLSGHNLVIKVEYSPYSNTMFLLMKNKLIKYYDLTPKQQPNQYQKSIPMYKQFKINGFLLWEKLLNDQPHSMTVHPFNYTILLVYEQLLKFHYFNIKHLFPAFIITSIKNCSMAKYSPLGDRIVLATNGAVIVLNSYTFQVMKTVSLPNILTQTQLKRFSSVRQRLPLIVNPKLITDFVFLKNGDMLVFSGHNSFTLILNNQKASHFGFIQLSHKQKISQILYDSINNLVIVLQQQNILILSRSTINSKNRCELISKIQISATSAYLIQQLGILFIGGRDGVLHLLKWPDYCQQELYARTTNKFYQFREPIISINVSANYNYIYTVSKSGSFCISQLQVNQNADVIPKQIAALLLTASEKPLHQGNRWLISRSDEERKERQIIKLRGEEADIVNHHSQIAKNQEIRQNLSIKNKKIELQAEYVKELKNYEEKLGLQHNLQLISLLKDQYKLFSQKRKREVQQLTSQKEEKMKQIFQQRSKLEQIYKTKVQQNEKDFNMHKQFHKQQIKKLIKILQNDEKTMTKKEKSLCTQQIIIKNERKCHLSNVQQDHIEDLKLINIEHNEEIEDLLNINQAILSKNRNKNIQIHDYQDKIGDLNIQKQKIEFDMYIVMEQKARYDQLKQKLIAQNEHHKKAYDNLMKVSKELQDKVHYQRKQQKRYQYKIAKLEQEIGSLVEIENELQQKKVKVNDQFIEEKNMNALRANTLIQLNNKYQQLKELKKERHYRNCLIKNQYTQIVKTFMRKMELNEQKAVQQICQAYRSSTFEKKKESVRNSEFQILKAQHQKMAKDASKWQDVKQTYMNAFFRNHRKLDQQNLKLTYRYNDLLRLSQQYKVQISNLQENIQKLQRNSTDWKSLPKVVQSRFTTTENRSRPNFSFLNVAKKQNKQNKTNLKKKLICVSLHQQSGKFITEA